MRANPRRGIGQYARRSGLLAALLALSLSPQIPAGAAIAESNTTIPSAGAPYTLSVAGGEGPVDSLVADLGAHASSIASMACTPPDSLVPIAFDGKGASVPHLHGGDSLLARAGGLPPGRAYRLLLDIPRARRSANVSVPIRYSPPTIAAAADAIGELVDARGNPGVRLTLPLDGASGAGTISLVEQGTAPGSAVRVRPLIVAPHPPAVEVHALDAAGRAVPAANVLLRGGGASCAAQTDARGNLLLSNVPAGTATVYITRGNEDLGTYHPDTVAGETTVLQRPAADRFHPGPVAHVQCDTRTGYAYSLLDTASGLPTGRSGEGPFGVFLSGVSTPDMFTAHLTSKAMGGSLGPIRHDVPIAVSVDTALHDTTAVHATLGADSPGGAGGPAGYTSLSFTLDVGRMPAGTNYVTITVGTGDQACIAPYLIQVAKDPTNTPLGTVDSYFDPASNSYQVDGVLPTHPKLRFDQPIDLSLPSHDLGGARLPSVDFATFQNEGSIGLEVHETIHTDGSWSGTVGGHARLMFFNYTIVNEELPQLQGGGPSLGRGRMSRTFHVYGKSIDTSLYDYVVFIPQFGIYLMLNVRYGASGNLDLEVGVPATLSEADFTIAPTFTASIVGSATLPTPFGAFSAALSGNLGFAAPITLRIPGSPQAHLGMLISVTATFGSPVGSPSPLTILPRQCLGDCGPAGQSLRPLAGPIAGSTTPGLAPLGTSVFPQAAALLGAAAPVSATITFRAGATAPEAQPATALAPDGSPATLWLTTQPDGAVSLHAQVGHGTPHTLSTNAVALSTPQVAWIGPRRALAVWMESTATPAALAQLRATSPDTHTPLLQALLAKQQLFSSIWDGRQWSAPTAITRGDSLNAEPSLAADAATGKAALAWVRGPLTSGNFGSPSGLSVAAMTFEHGVWSAPTTVSAARTSGVNMPRVAIDTHGNPAIAWLEGPIGMGRPMFAPLGTGGRSVPAPVAVSGLPTSAQRIALAFDAAGRPVVAEAASQTLAAARRDNAGHWMVWNLGAGTMPELSRGAAGSMVLLAEQPSRTPASGSTYQPAMAVLTGMRWSPRAALAASTATQASGALASDPATGRARVVLGSRPIAGFAPTAGFLDRASALPALDIPPADPSTLAPEAITLSDGHPSPGELITADLRMRNLSTVTMPPGTPVRVRISASGKVVDRTVLTMRTLEAGGVVTLHLPLAAPESPLTITVGTGRVRLSATLGLPDAPRDVTVSDGAGGGLLIQWEAGTRHDTAGYRVYRVSTGGAPELAGFAHGTTWVDAQAQGTAAIGRYAVATVDTAERESPLIASR